MTLLPFSLFAQWEVTFNKPSSSFYTYLTDCHGPNCLVHSDKGMLRSTDYGRTWEMIQNPIFKESIYAVSFYDDTTVYMIFFQKDSVDSQLAVSTDIGQTWRPVKTPLCKLGHASKIRRLPASNDLLSINYGINDYIAPLGQDSIFHHVPSIPGDHLARFNFKDDYTGYILADASFLEGYTPGLSRTTDGGHTWKTIIPTWKGKRHFFDFSFLSPSEGYFTNYNGLFYTSDSAGTIDSIYGYSFDKWSPPVPRQEGPDQPFYYNNPMQMRFNASCGGLISGGLFDGKNSLLTLIQVTPSSPTPYQKIYEGPGFPFHNLLALEDGTFLGITANGLILKSTGCDFSLPANYPWDRLNNGTKEPYPSTSGILTPNPTNGLVTIRMKGDHRISAYQLFDSGGKRLRSRQFDPPVSLTSLDIRDQAHGTYVLLLTSDRGTTDRMLIVKQ